MNARYCLLPVISMLYFSNIAVAEDATGYVALSNSGYIGVTRTVLPRLPDEADNTGGYRDLLIIDEVTGMEPKPLISSTVEHDK